jgi:hypothetical protein
MRRFKTQWNELPFERRVAIVELHHEMVEANPDPYQESLQAYRNNERKRKRRITKHVAKLTQMRQQSQ